MRRPLRIFFTVFFVALGAGCGEHGDTAIAYGDGLGEEWSAGGRPEMRIFVENYFTRDVVIAADAPGMHYEVTVGPIRKRYMIVPVADYKITATTQERMTGNNYLYVNADDRNGSKGLHVRIRF